jgi:hypothetical protein
MKERQAMDNDRRDRRRTRDECVDTASADSFPASDPPSHSGITGPGEPRPARRKPPASHSRGDESRPTGTPTSERHATETAHQWEDEEHPQQKHPD